jgi:hypothetical protein
MTILLLILHERDKKVYCICKVCVDMEFLYSQISQLVVASHTTPQWTVCAPRLHLYLWCQIMKNESVGKEVVVSFRKNESG